MEEQVESKAFLNLNVCTWWNSTSIVLMGAIIYAKVFTRYCEEDALYALDLVEEKGGFGYPDGRDWENAKKMVDFLGHFCDLTICVSSSHHVTSNNFLFKSGEIHILIKDCMASTNHLQAATGNRVKEKFDKYWGSWHAKEKEDDTRMIALNVPRRRCSSSSLWDNTAERKTHGFTQEIGRASCRERVYVLV